MARSGFFNPPTDPDELHKWMLREMTMGHIVRCDTCRHATSDPTTMCLEGWTRLMNTLYAKPGHVLVFDHIIPGYRRE